MYDDLKCPPSDAIACQYTFAIMMSAVTSSKLCAIAVAGGFNAGKKIAANPNVTPSANPFAKSPREVGPAPPTTTEKEKNESI